MPLMRCIVLHRSCTLAWACTKLCMACMTVGICMLLCYHVILMVIPAFRVIHYIPLFPIKIQPSSSKSLPYFS